MPWWKRPLDMVLSLAALIVLTPLFILIALAVLIESGRPVLFAQQRVGYGFRPFTMWKFRSMRKGDGPQVTSGHDKRITRVGKILRRTKLDETPQFWNVLRGDMSLVGPRPEVPAYVRLYPGEYERILRVRPGITDPAAIAFREEEVLLGASLDPEGTYLRAVLPAKLRLSEAYAAHTSFRLDISILFQTILAVFGPRWRVGKLFGRIAL